MRRARRWRRARLSRARIEEGKKIEVEVEPNKGKNIEVEKEPKGMEVEQKETVEPKAKVHKSEEAQAQLLEVSSQNGGGGGSSQYGGGTGSSAAPSMVVASQMQHGSYMVSYLLHCFERSFAQKKCPLPFCLFNLFLERTLVSISMGFSLEFCFGCLQTVVAVT